MAVAVVVLEVDSVVAVAVLEVDSVVAVVVVLEVVLVVQEEVAGGEEDFKS